MERATELDAWEPSHDWNEALKNMGIHAAYRRDMTDPEHELTRGFGSASSSILDWIREADYFLILYPRGSYERQKQA